MIRCIYVLLVAIMVLGNGPLAGQNLVPNPGFETISFCPLNLAQINLATGWIRPSAGTSDLYHTCGFVGVSGVPSSVLGYNLPRTGNSMAGLVLLAPGQVDYREYIQIQLASPLIAGTEYRLEFNLKLPARSRFSSSAIGAHLSTTPIFSLGAFLSFPPQVENSLSTFITDTLTWHCIDGIFVANGGEQYLTIGNFRSDAGTPSVNNPQAPAFSYQYAYFLIDDICLYPAKEPPCCTVLSHDGINLSVEDRGHTGVQLSWRSNETDPISHFRIERSDHPSDFFEINQLEAHSNPEYSWIDMFPVQDNWYRVIQVNVDGREIESPWVHLDIERESAELFRAWIGNGALHVVLAETETAGYIVHLMDVQGRKIIELENPDRELRQPLEGLPGGIYILEVIAPNGQRGTKKLVYSR